MELNLVQELAVYAIPVVFAITLHEAAHGYVAKHFGDVSAYRLGRVSLNPLRHIDLVGTILVPILILLTTKFIGGAGMLFGWAKPVPVNYHSLRRPKEHMLWVAAAGPGSNLLQALFWAALWKLAIFIPSSYFSVPVRLIAEAGVQVNLAFMILNLIPVLPLDGGRIAFSLLPDRMAASYARLEPYGLPFLLVLVYVETQTTFRFLSPLMSGAEGFVRNLFHV